jgi:hypothetical protein
MIAPEKLFTKYYNKLSLLATLLTSNFHQNLRCIWQQSHTSWYGPLAFLLVLPAIFDGLIRGDNFLKLATLSLLFFYVAVCYKIGWMQWNNRFFSLFFRGSGICIT